MNKYIITIMLLCVVSGCSKLEKNTRDMRYSVDSNYDKMRYKVSGYIYDRHEPNPNAINTPRPYYKASYCYQLAFDLVCYDKPRDDLRSRFVGMQGEDGSYYSDLPLVSKYDASHKKQNPNNDNKLHKKSKKPLGNAPIELMAGF